MATIGRSGIFAVCFTALTALVTQTPRHDAMLEGVPSGKTRVLDLSYAINDKLVPWPGDEKFFEAKVNASVEKNGYFTRSFWMLEHYGTHMDAQGKMHFPGFSSGAAKLLIERKVSGLGCDTMSIDYGASGDFAVHRLALGASLYHLENLADLSALPERGAFLIVAPIKLEGGSGGPVRVFAMLEEAKNNEVIKQR